MTAQATYYIIRALVALVAIPFHEAGHALAAWLLGDATAKREGRLSLNPFAHFDLLGTLCMVFAGVGWAKPVSTNPRNFKNPKWGMALTALAGPVANLVLAYLGMVAWKVMYYWAPVNNATIYIAMFLRYLVLMNVRLQLAESAAGTETIGTVTATTNINVRASASETADRLGVLSGGDSAELVGTEGDWSKIKYNGQIGYVKSEYVQ